MNALLAALLIVGTAISAVALGVMGAYYAVTGLLAACNPSRPKAPLATLVPRQSSVSGD
jgi:hypothetical protein